METLDADTRQLVLSLTQRSEELERRVSLMEQKFDTLETPLWKRVWFRIDGWPGQRELNADQRRWRPWH